MKPEVKVKLDKIYGRMLAYPDCTNARNFARLTQTKTLTKEHLLLIQALGFELMMDFYGESLPLNLDESNL